MQGMRTLSLTSLWGALVLICLSSLADSASKGPRIAVVSISTGPIAKPYIAQAVVNKAMYATRNAYHFRLFHHLDSSRAPAWSKILALKTVIKSREYDWVMWLDGDVVITNFGTRIESLLPRNPAIDFLITRDCNDINTGAFLLRASRSALASLDEIYGGPHVTSQILDDLWWEQRSFINLYGTSEDLRNRTLEVPQKTFNSYPPGYGCYEEGGTGWSEADFVVHFPGAPDDLRENLTKEYLQKVIY